MTLEQKIARVEELAREKRKIDAELLSLLGGETRKGRPPKSVITEQAQEIAPA